ncbi:replicative DNA helicase [Lactobacillus sp. W8089]|nr:replicative DNA helicase [Bombilactobacillus mellis]MBI0107079.1 replicative DNA helicase [Lactobacillus sp. W8086]MBI0108543.1 replicative DNA helicase [Lactobacillus sp. W8085]MBI0111761.1 replicative DNA helicase [Lactobacillus sp. W8088]MBI0115476.1 replicative DNA helicase [Lactobacillus sp. W8087]MBI0119201.1 replicative DNA helicase [Lactobacillus sp. W8089]MBI0131166.1 replicative DNA helicase [Lactobacillus sp. W8090]
MNNDLIQRVPPNNKEAEQSVLGSILLRPEALIEALEYVTADSFYQHAHQLIFTAMMELNEADQGIDVVTVKNTLDDKNQLDDIGGVSYLADLASIVPTAANVVYYAKIVADKALLRRLITTATDIVAQSYEDQDNDVNSILDAAERQIMNVGEDQAGNGFKKISDVLNATIEDIDQRAQEDSSVTGLSTGYAELDKVTAGLHPDELVILAARPGVGKTAFALNVAENVAVHTPTTVAIFSLEMGAEQLASRLLCAQGSIDANDLRTGNLNDEEWKNLVVATGILSRTSIYIDDTPGIKMAEIRAKCRRLAKETGNLGLVIVDYLQLIEGTGQENRQQEVSVISRQLKRLAKELHVPVIALSQLSRGVEQRQDKRPLLSDIRESGSIEQDADVVAFLYRDDYYNDESDSDNSEDVVDTNAGEVEVIISKNRSGPRGTIKLLFVKSYNKFAAISPLTEG